MYISSESILVVLFVGLVAGWLAAQSLSGESNQLKVQLQKFLDTVRAA